MEIPTKYSSIPKVLHFIWLGPFSAPLEWINSWKPFCEQAGFSMKLWTDTDIEKLNLVNKKYYNDSDNYQQKSDIARYEIMYRFGGVYIDCDMVFLGNDLTKYIPFECGIFIGVNEPKSVHLGTDIHAPFIANGFFVAPPKHEIMRKCIARIPERMRLPIKHAFIKTGPVLLNECISEAIIILPSKWIFSLDFHKVHNVKDPSVFKNSSLVYTYNNAEYPFMKKLRILKETGKCMSDNECASLM